MFGPKTSGLPVNLGVVAYVRTYIRVVSRLCDVYLVWERHLRTSNMKSCVTPSSSCTHTNTHQPGVTLMNEILLSCKET